MKTWQKWMMPVSALALLMAAPPAFAQDEEGEAEVADAPRTLEAPAAEGGDQQAQFNRELLSVEEQVNTLKERVFRSKATLQLLAEIVAQGTGTGSRASISHVNELGRTYKIESLSYYLDGQSRYARTAADGGLDGVEEIKVFDGPIQAGTHTLSVTMQLQGSSGVFSYVDQIGFNVQSSATFEVKDGDSCAIRVEADEHGGLSRSFTERPDIAFDIRCTRSMDDSGAR